MLKLYENIRKRRLELNISQQELGERVGYAGKSMISQIEKGIVDLPESMIMKFATALDCSPAYLMGWEDELTQETFDKSYAKSQQTSRMKYYFDMFAKLPKESQDEVINFIDYQVKKNEPKED